MFSSDHTSNGFRDPWQVRTSSERAVFVSSIISSYYGQEKDIYVICDIRLRHRLTLDVINPATYSLDFLVGARAL